VAVLLTGKPTIADVVAAFESRGCRVSAYRGTNPYRDPAASERTAMFTVCAVAA
jgi:hypothetical protein